MRSYQRAEGPPQRESLAEAAERLAGLSSKAAARALDALRLDLTLTAHPTEATRWSVMEHAGHVSARLAPPRRVAMRLLIDRVERLASRSSQSAEEMGAGRAALEASLRRDASLMPEVTRRLGERRRHEPVRAKLNYISERLLVTGEQPDSPLAYREAAQLRRDLELVRDASGGPAVADGAVKDLLRQVTGFGLHLARLDV